MKRFLQGLGIGVFAATLIFSVSYYVFGNKKMSDDDIINRAKQLGMVQPTEAPIINTELNEQPAGDEGADNAQQPLSDGAADNTQQPLSDEAADNTQQPLSDGAADNTQQPSGDGTAVNTQQPDITAMVQNTADSEIQSDIKRLVINKGDGATTVSWNLQQLGIISDAVDFDNYLREKGYTRSLQVGTYDLNAGMNYDEIAAEIIMSR